MRWLSRSLLLVAILLTLFSYEVNATLEVQVNITKTDGATLAGDIKINVGDVTGDTGQMEACQTDSSIYNIDGPSSNDRTNIAITNGTFSETGLVAGSYTVWGTCTWQDLDRGYTASNDFSKSGINVTADGPSVTTGSLEGTLLADLGDDSPDPEQTKYPCISGSSINLKGTSGTYPANPDPDGKIRISGIKPGKYVLTGKCRINPTGGTGQDQDLQFQYPKDPSKITIVAGQTRQLGQIIITDFPFTGSTDNPGSEEDAVQCTAEGGLGWIVCGVIEFLTDQINKIYNGFIEPYLQSKPLTQSASLKASWTNFRNVANILLIPLFFVIIFAQALSLNLDAYTIKKMLPRLAAATILIQFSFYIVAIAVDVTNVLGNGLGNLITSTFAGDSAIIISLGGPTGALGFLAGLGAIVGGILLLPTIIGALFALIIPLALAVLGVLLTLVFRQVLIVLLAILAPIAFTLWVLPNTSKFFKLWWDYLFRALLMYPLIVLLFAAGTIASSLLSAGELITEDGTTGAGIIGDIGAIVAVLIPIALVPFTFKFAGSAIAGVYGAYGKFQGWAMGGKEGDKRLGRLSKQMAANYQKGLLGMRGGSRGGVARGLTNPLSYLPTTGTFTRIPVIGGLGRKARSGPLTQLNMQRGASKKTLEDLNANSDMLRALTRVTSKRGLSNYIRQEMAKPHGMTREQAFQVEKMYDTVGGPAMQAAAAVALAEKGGFGAEELTALTHGFRSSSGFLEEVLGDVGSASRKAGNYSYGRFAVAGTRTGTVTSARVNDSRVQDDIDGMETRDFGEVSARPESWGVPVSAAGLPIPAAPGTFISHLDHLMADPARRPGIIAKLHEIRHDDNTSADLKQRVSAYLTSRGEPLIDPAPTVVTGQVQADVTHAAGTPLASAPPGRLPVQTEGPPPPPGNP